MSTQMNSQAQSSRPSSDAPQNYLLERSTSEQDLSFAVLHNDGTSSCQSAESSQSLPDLTGNQALTIPPSYYQICLSDLFHLKSLQQNTNQPEMEQQQNTIEEVSSSVMATADSVTLCHKMTREIANLREKLNDPNLRLTVDQNQSILKKLSQLSEENREMRKSKMALEDKVDTVVNEVKLLATEMEEVKAVNHFLKKENLQAKNDSLKVEKDLREEKERSTMSRQSSIQSNPSNEADNSGPSSASLSHLSHRIELLESKLNTATQHNAEVSHRLNECMQRLVAEERAKTELTDKLNFISDINQLMQVKLLSIESKVAATISLATSPQEPFHTSIPQSVLTNRLYPNPNIVQPQPTSHSNQKASLRSPPIAAEFQEGLGNLKQKLTALVSPIKLDRQHSYSSKPTAPVYEEAVVQPNAAAAFSPEVAMGQQQPQPEVPEDESHRRHRRHHRIKLFSSRRRH